MTEKYGITLDLSRDSLFDLLGIKRLKELHRKDLLSFPTHSRLIKNMLSDFTTILLSIGLATLLLFYHLGDPLVVYLSLAFCLIWMILHLD